MSSTKPLDPSDVTLAERLCLSMLELAALTGICRNSLYSAVRRGELRVTKIGKRTVVAMGEARRFLDGPRIPGTVAAKKLAKAKAGRAA
jgi:hypothetical protein